jgi:hypothetical protein
VWAEKNWLKSMDLSGLVNLNYLIFWSNRLESLDITGVAHGKVPYRLYTTGNASLYQIKVTSVSAIQNYIAAIIAATPVGQTPAVGIYTDQPTSGS